MDTRNSSSIDSLISTLISLLILTWLLWIMWTLVIPSTAKAKMRVSLLRSSSRVTSGLARRTGAHSMGVELATNGAVQDYRLPYWLAVRGDRLAELARFRAEP